MMISFATMNKPLSILLFIVLFSTQIIGQNNSVLSQGKWYKISTNKNGIYKLSYSSVSDLGVSMNDLKIAHIKLYGNGGGMLPKLNSDFRHNDLVENAIEIYDANNNGIFETEDFILFYGQSPHIWEFNSSTNLFKHQTHLFSDEVNYFLTINKEEVGKRVLVRNELQNPNITVNSFNDYDFHESEIENLIHSGRNWFGEQFGFQNSQTFNFSFPNIIATHPLTIKTVVAARSFVSSSFTVKANTTNLAVIGIPNITSDYLSEYATVASKSSEYISSSSNLAINLDYASNDNNANAWLDYIEINARRKLKMSGNSLSFRDVESLSEQIAAFTLEGATASIRVWDITDPTSISELSTTINNNVLSFNDSVSELHEYIAFDKIGYYTPSLKGSIENQNLHNIPSDVEYVVITHTDFLSAANDLAVFHEEVDGLKSVVVTPEQIYNEFSSGAQDVSAIRDFLRMLYKRPASQLKYVLLFGDGSYDPKDRIADNTNFIPTYQSENSTFLLQSYVADDYFGLLDDNEGLFVNDLVDIGIGRFPVSTLNQANDLVEKVKYYYAKESFGTWRNDVAFVADDGDASDGNTHMWQADSLANIINNKYGNINLEKIYLDNYEQESTPGGPRSAAAKAAIDSKIAKGALLVNYTGHGSPTGWTQERVLSHDQINAWENKDRLPLFMTATCKFSYFDDPSRTSAGELVLLNPNGGAIALLSTTRLVYSGPNYNLNTKFIKVLFEKDNGDFPRLGDVFRKTKVLSGTSTNNRNFTLLGDPALCLAYPKYDVKTTVIADTLKALGEVIVEGEIINDEGFLLTSFNGTIYPTVYDKEIISTTLGQESCTPMPYRDQNNILYKGEASVVDGKFSFSFVVPKDIAYNYGKGKISYYAISDSEDPEDASGNSLDFVIGGTANDVDYDYDGADLELYMNTRQFVDGGITDKNPTLLVDIADFSGINTVGNGIGHDIVAVLDGVTSQPYILNEYYRAEKDNYKKGTLSFPFSNLEKGEHTIHLKVWDVFNNSSESSITFVVTDDNEFAIADYMAFPNPFSNTVTFEFQHNKTNQDLEVVLDIYSITGRLVKSIENSYFDNGYLIGPINWDGKDDYGQQLGAGVYIAQLRVNSSDGDYISKSIRVILLPQ